MGEAGQSFEAFYRNTHGRLFTALCLVTANRDEAEEIMQEAFLRLWERWDRVGGLQDPTGYLYRTSMNLFRSRYRRAALALRCAVGLAREVDHLAEVEDRVVVAAMLRPLTPDQRAAVVLTSMLGWSSEEAGQLLGMKASNVRTLATRARASIRTRAGEPV